MKNSVIKQELLPDYFYMPWVLHFLARGRNNELHLIFSWPIYYAAGLGCLETAANPFVTVLGPKAVVTSA